MPHDAMLGNLRTVDAPGGSAQAFFTGGHYVYEKRFLLPEAWKEQPVRLQFEGVYKNAAVSVNGQPVGGAAYGYIPFWVDCGVLPEGENVITVTCDNADQPDSRWYSGAGIYRPVWVWVGNGLTEEDIRVTTLGIDPARVEVRIQMPKSPLPSHVVVEILDPKDSGMALASQELSDSMLDDECSMVFDLPQAQLWSEGNPYQYVCHVSLCDENGAWDTTEVSFGIRQITCSEKGFFVNGYKTLLRGGCIHQDCGILGAACHDESEYRRVRMLKNAGFNAIRSAHNPANRALLDACDALGMYVMDETWDMWYNHKNPYDYAGQWKEHYRGDIRAMVARDYNHPSVLMYSIGNEVSEPARPQGIEATEEMVALFHELDASRPVTGGFNLMIIANASKGKGVYKEEGGRDDSAEKKMGGMNSTMFNMITSMVGTSMNRMANGKKADKATSPCLDALDLCGYNYASGRYPLEGQAHPKRLVFGSETFPWDIAKNWKMVRQYPYLCGDFMWTAWDYLGEAGIGAWAYTPDGKGFNKPYPWLLGDTGAMDILGNPNGELFLAEAAWGLLDAPRIGVQPVNHPGVTPAKGSWRGTNALPSWSWKGCEGNPAVVEVYYDCAAVELLLNGKSLGRKKVKDCHASFRTKYVAGELKAVAYDEAGSVISESVLHSAQGGLRIAVEPEQSQAHPGKIIYIPVRIAGENGVTESNADETLTVTVEGGKLLAFGSANPRTEERYQDGRFRTYYGQAMAVVRTGAEGTLAVSVTGTDLGTACASIEINAKSYT